MSERSEYWIVCDGCGTESGRYSTNVKAELYSVLDHGWEKRGDIFHRKHYCPQCVADGKAGPAKAVAL